MPSTRALIRPLLALTVLCLACTGAGLPPFTGLPDAGDGGGDAGPDAGDAGPSSDSGVDAGLPDSGMPDASIDAGTDLPSQAEIAAIVAPLFDGGWSSGMAIGLLDATGQVVYGFGEVVDGSGVVPDGRTLFEIGSVTKMFTELWVLSQIDAGGQMDDPVSTYLPSDWTVPSSGGRFITLRELGDHTAGLPDFPTNLPAGNPLVGAATYSAQDLKAFLASYVLPAIPGTQWSYSNTGVGLLGYAWSLREDGGYEAELTQDLLTPLGLSDTVFVPDVEQAAREAAGHDWDLNPGPLTTIGPGLEAAGYLKSTVDDLLRVAAIRVGLLPPVFASAMALQQVPQFGPLDGLGTRYAFGLFVDTDGTIWHTGGTASFTSFFGFYPPTQKGVVVLCNAADCAIDSLGLALLRSLMGVPITTPIVPPTLQLTPSQLDQFTGDYLFGGGFSVVFTRTGNRFFGQGPGQPVVPLYADTTTSFYARDVQAEFVFSANAMGLYDTVTLYQNGGSIVGTRQ